MKIRYELDDPGIGIRFPTEATELSLLHSVQTGSGTHPYALQLYEDGCVWHSTGPLHLTVQFRAVLLHWSLSRKYVCQHNKDPQSPRPRSMKPCKGTEATELRVLLTYASDGASSSVRLYPRNPFYKRLGGRYAVKEHNICP
jgi:hypothetical protein